MLRAKDIMSSNVASIRGSATVAEAVQLMKDRGLWALMVSPCAADLSVGIVTKDDIVYKVATLGHNPEAVRVSEIMTKPCITVQPEMSIDYVARLFASTPLLYAPVIGNEPLGIISLRDIKATLCVEQSKRMSLVDELETTREQGSTISEARGNPSKTVRQECIQVLQ